jgi:hypothetical protein
MAAGQRLIGQPPAGRTVRAEENQMHAITPKSHGLRPTGYRYNTPGLENVTDRLLPKGDLRRRQGEHRVMTLLCLAALVALSRRTCTV